MSHISKRSTRMDKRHILFAACRALGATTRENTQITYYGGRKQAVQIGVEHPSFRQGFGLGFDLNRSTGTFEAVGDLSFGGHDAFLGDLTMEYSKQEVLEAAASVGHELVSTQTQGGKVVLTFSAYVG